MTTASRIEELIKANPDTRYTAQEIAAQLNIHKASAHRTLNKLRDERQVIAHSEITDDGNKFYTYQAAKPVLLEQYWPHPVML